MKEYSYMCLAILFVFSFLVSCIPTSSPIEPKTWQKTYGRTGLDGAQCIKQTKDGGYIAVGWTYSYEQGLADVYVVKIDANGELTWRKTYGGDDWGKANSIECTSDGRYVFAGRSDSFGTGCDDVYILKINEDENVVLM